MKSRLRLALLLVACCGCSKDTAARRTLVFAAASLTAPFEAIAKEFERGHPGTKIALHCAGTPQLVLQIDQGAVADVLAAADLSNMQKVVAAGLTATAPREFARNRLAIVVGRDNAKGIATLADLARGDVKVALCGPEVPAGKYAREALAKAAVTVRSVSDEANVNALVSKIRLGELDAGIVYATDVRSADGLAAVAIPDVHNVVASYPIVVLAAGHERALADTFVAFVLSPAGRKILVDFGFLVP